MKVRLYGRSPFALEGVGIDRRPKRTEKLDLDLAHLEFASPLDVAGLALLASCVDASPTVVPPEDESVTAYLAAMGLPAAIRWEIDVSPATDIGFSIPVRRLTHPDEWDDTLGEMLEPMHKNLGAELANSVQQILGELGDNAGSHGASSAGYFLAGQHYTGKTSQMVSGIWLAVVDAGVGIREHLSGRPEYEDIDTDHAAIRLAVQPGVTGTYPPRGYGLVDVRRYAGRQAPGRVLIRSGTGYGVLYPAPKGTGRTARYGELPHIPGTWVMVLAGDPR